MVHGRPLQFQVVAKCTKSRARVGKMRLPHHCVDTPVFMPVGTQGTVKGLLPEQLEKLDCQIILANTYHVGERPGIEVIGKAGGLHHFMNWKRALLTDSGGFQMVSLSKLSDVTEEGVEFRSPYDNRKTMLTPERSIQIQNCIGADIIMQLDDVVRTTHDDPERVRQATERTSRWLRRCIAAHQKPDRQSVFPIVQGLLDPQLRVLSAESHVKEDTDGFAIGGLSGGEAKERFWPIVKQSSELLPSDRPRYLMGVGVAVDLVVCVALGVDMFDCVFPTRTARFGSALVDSGQLNLKSDRFKLDFGPIDDECECSTCQRYSRAYLHSVATVETISCHLLTVHNIAYQMRLMKNMRESIENETFPDFVKRFMNKMYTDGAYPEWVKEALKSVDIDLTLE